MLWCKRVIFAVVIIKLIWFGGWLTPAPAQCITLFTSFVIVFFFWYFCLLITDKSNDHCTVYLKDNIRIVYTLLFNIWRFFIPTFHENSHSIQWIVLLIKNITISIFSQIKPVSWLRKEINIFPPKKPIVFARIKLSSSNEESYLAKSKQSREFYKRNGHFFLYEHIFELI